MTTARKLQLADDLETALQNVPPLPIGVFRNLSQFIRTLRSPHTLVLENVVLENMEPEDLIKLGIVELPPPTWAKSPTPDLGEIETEKGSGE